MSRASVKLLWIALVMSTGLSSAFADERPSAPANPSKKITLQTAKGEISDVLRMVAEQGGLNLVVGPEVKGQVSVYLEDVPVQIALKSIAVNNGFNYTVEHDVITVSRPPERIGEPAPPPLETRVFVLRSQDAERVKDALEFALSKYGKMKVLNENSSGGYGVQRLNSLAGEFADSGSSGSNSNGGVIVSGQNGSNGANSGMATGPMRSQNGVEQPHNARKLIVTDVKDHVDQIAELIADLDKLPPQVLIEARIVEMSTELQRQLGIDWNVSALANGPILNHQWPLRNRAGFASGDQIMRNTSGGAMTTAGLALGSIDFSQFSAMLQANQTDNSIRLLANPRLLVFNNHSASILVGERYPILQASISNFGTVTEAFSTYIPVGVQLEVTPTIMTDGTVSMMVHPATSALGDDVVGTTGLKVARIRTRELDTRVIMHDGQTIVLGGLISDRKTHQAKKVPGLGDVPVLDIFFRQENPGSERVDLLIFLTAHIEGAVEISERDRQVFEMYKPQFKQIERLQDVPLHFEIPTEYEAPRPMFSDPPKEEASEEAPPPEMTPRCPPPQPMTTPQTMKAVQAPPTAPNQPRSLDADGETLIETSKPSAPAVKSDIEKAVAAPVELEDGHYPADEPVAGFQPLSTKKDVAPISDPVNETTVNEAMPSIALSIACIRGITPWIENVYCDRLAPWASEKIANVSTALRSYERDNRPPDRHVVCNAGASLDDAP
jgi:type IV pilus secretin PilQ/predicted competence protein